MDGERAYATEWLVNFRHIIKCQDALIKELCDKFLLTKIEGTIIATVYKGNMIKNLIMDCRSYT